MTLEFELRSPTIKVLLFNFGIRMTPFLGLISRLKLPLLCLRLIRFMVYFINVRVREYMGNIDSEID